MINTRHEKTEEEKLVKQGTSTTLEIPDVEEIKKTLTNQRVRRVADPYIRPHRTKNKVYYTHCRGDKEIYLGSADFILKAVLFYKDNVK
jgi:hypothetical protein